MDNTERLIQYVRANRCLYDYEDKDYKNVTKKMIIWDIIAKELNQSNESIKTKWKNLRDGYTKYKKELKDTTLQKKKYYNWMWGPHLQFLDSVSRTSASIVNSLIDKHEMSSPSRSMSSPVHLQNSNDEQQTLHWLPDLMHPSPPPEKRRKETDSEKDVDRILDYLESRKNKPSDATDFLFKSYSQTFKSFQPRTQAMLKIKLAELFSEAELSELSEDYPVKQSLEYTES